MATLVHTSPKWYRRVDSKQKYTITAVALFNNISSTDTNSGLIHEFLEIVSYQFNFTMVPDPGTVWGRFPVTGGWFDWNATFTGIFKEAVQGQTDLGLSFWTNLIERHLWVDTSFAMYRRRIQLLINKQVYV